MAGTGNTPQAKTSNLVSMRFAGWIRRQNLVMWITVAILLLWIFLPGIWALLSTFKARIEVYQVPLRLLPRDPSLRAYNVVLQATNFWRYFGNSVYLTATSTVLTLFISIWAAYGFARMKFPLHNVLLVAILVPRLIPRISLVVPLYGMVVQLGLLNTYLALIISYTVTSLPFAVWILSNVLRSVPREVEESALIDGASLWRIITRLMIPMSSAGILTVGIFTVRETWNEFPFVLSFTTDAAVRTLPYQLFLLRDTLGIEDWPVINSFAILTAVPILLIYFIFSRRITAGIVQGSIK